MANITIDGGRSDDTRPASVKSVVSLSTGEFFVAFTQWNQGPYDVSYAILSPEGNSVSNTEVIGQTNNNQADVAVFSTDGFFFSWTEQGATVGQQFFPDRTLWGDRFFLIDGSVPKLVAGPDRTLLVASVGGDGSDSGIRARVTDLSIAGSGNTLTVNTETINRQNEQEVAYLANGNYVVVWQSDPDANNRTNVKAQLLDPEGNLLGPEIAVSPDSEVHRYAHVAGMPSGGFIVAYSEFTLDRFVLKLKEYDDQGNFLATRQDLLPTANARVAGINAFDDNTVAITYIDVKNDDSDTFVNNTVRVVIFKEGDVLGNRELVSSELPISDVEAGASPDGNLAVSWVQTHESRINGKYETWNTLKATTLKVADVQTELFTDDDDDVNFNKLTKRQESLVKNGVNISDALKGDDTIILPSGKKRKELGITELKFYGGEGIDTIDGSKFPIKGNGGRLQLFGGSEDDTILGSNSRDILNPGDGVDRIEGLNGGDIFVGGQGGENFLYGFREFYALTDQKFPISAFYDGDIDIIRYRDQKLSDIKIEIDSFKQLIYAEGKQFSVSGVNRKTNQKFVDHAMGQIDEIQVGRPSNQIDLGIGKITDIAQVSFVSEVLDYVLFFLGPLGKGFSLPYRALKAAWIIAESPSDQKFRAVVVEALCFGYDLAMGNVVGKLVEKLKIEKGPVVDVFVEKQIEDMANDLLFNYRVIAKQEIGDFVQGLKGKSLTEMIEGFKELQKNIIQRTKDSYIKEVQEIRNNNGLDDLTISASGPSQIPLDSTEVRDATVINVSEMMASGDSGADTIDTSNAPEAEFIYKLKSGDDRVLLKKSAIVFTDSDNDVVTGSSKADFVFLGSGDDAASTGGGADYIDAGTGSDRVKGGAGADTIIFGPGKDKGTGGRGNDTFIFSNDKAQGRNIITDFDPTRDVISFEGGAVPVGLRVFAKSDDIVVDWDKGAIILRDVDPADFGLGDIGLS